MRYSYVLWLLFLSSALSCQPTTTWKNADTFEAGIATGEVSDVINEASGLVASRNNIGGLWTHNDSGGNPNLYLIDEMGTLRWTVRIEGIENRDWEDIAIGAGPKAGKNYLYIGEIGDNNAVHNKKYLYRIEEPFLNLSFSNKDTIITEVDQLEFIYPDGLRDAETVLISPTNSIFYIISKREPSVRIYMGSTAITQPQELKKVGSLPLTQLVSGDISMDGREVLLKNYDEIYYWRMGDTTTTFVNWITEKNPKQLVYVREPQGESIAWKTDGSGYFTLSEKEKTQPTLLYFYKRK